VPRPVWTGTISFGLVAIPVKVFPAIESHRPVFHEVESGTGRRIRYKRVAEGSGREVPWEKIERGYEVGKGRIVELSKDELTAAEPKAMHTIDVEQFVSLDEIDPVLWDQTYYVAPDGAAGEKSYALFREALKRSGRVAIGRFVMRTKERVVCLRPFQNVIALQTMFFPDEVRDVHDLPDLPKGAAATSAARGRELTLALQIIDSLSDKWDPSKYQDTFRDRVMKLVEEKAKGGEIAVEPESTGGGGQVVDLLAALKASLAKGKGAGARKSEPKSAGHDGKGEREGAATRRAAHRSGGRASSGGSPRRASPRRRSSA
jgi:DNA end-binding protein Ku